jgi:hypothetical protein
MGVAVVSPVAVIVVVAAVFEVNQFCTQGNVGCNYFE